MLPGHLADDAVERFDSVGDVEHLAYLGRVLKQGYQVRKHVQNTYHMFKTLSSSILLQPQCCSDLCGFLNGSVERHPTGPIPLRHLRD